MGRTLTDECSRRLHERRLDWPKIRPPTSLLARNQSCLHELFHVVRNRWLREAHWFREIADAHLPHGARGDQ